MTKAESQLKPQIIELVNQIPQGKVVNYGAIGDLVGVSGQIVGWMLSGMPESEWSQLPWWRVIAKTGEISSLKLGMKGNRQIQLLEEEGVEVQNGVVDMAKYFHYFTSNQSEQTLL
jgi:methylated-DNA-protein-cysteine methyltransferase related protein